MPIAGKKVECCPIGVIRSPHTDPARTPIQPRYARGVEGTVEILPELKDALDDIEGFSHILLLYHFHRAKAHRLKVVPFLDEVERGLFSTRYPARPNPIGLSVVRLLRREGTRLHVSDVDILDGTPLLDIKPHVVRFGVEDSIRSGWQDAIDETTAMERGRRQGAATE